MYVRAIEISKWLILKNDKNNMNERNTNINMLPYIFHFDIYLYLITINFRRIWNAFAIQDIVICQILKTSQFKLWKLAKVQLRNQPSY